MRLLYGFTLIVLGVLLLIYVMNLPDFNFIASASSGALMGVGSLVISDGL